MRVIWTADAVQDRRDIFFYIAAENPEAALRLDERFSFDAQRLQTMARRGRKGLAPGTREIFPHRRYRLMYEVEGDVVWILALVHSARQWPPLR